MKRQCGECALCCKLVPVRELHKAGGERCRHQRRTGCRVYHRPGMPPSCAMWSCLWLTNPYPETAALSRPDRSHCVVDLMPDFVIAQDNETGAEQRVNAVQIWVDPHYRDAWRDPTILRFIEARAREDRACTVIRHSETETIVVFAPCLSSDGQWHFVDKSNGGRTLGRNHTVHEIFGGHELEIELTPEER